MPRKPAAAKQAPRSARRRVPKKPSAARKPSTVARKPTPTALCLSQCASDYALSLSNPFVPRNACVPAQFPIPSGKYSAYNVGTMTTSLVNGWGYVCIDPINMVQQSLGSVLYTTSTYNSPGFLIENSSFAGVQAATTNSVHSSTFFGTTPGLAQFRIVSAGLRLTYADTNLTRGGRYIAFHDPNHETVVTSSRGFLYNNNRSLNCPITDAPITVTYFPVEPDNLNFGAPTIVDPTTVGANAPRFYMIIGASSAEPEAEFFYEAYVNYEAQGRQIRTQTPSHSDPVGFSAVLEQEANTRPYIGSAANYASSFLNRVADTVSQTTNAVSSGVRVASAVYNAYQSMSNPLGSDGVNWNNMRLRD